MVAFITGRFPVHVGDRLSFKVPTVEEGVNTCTSLTAPGTLKLWTRE